MRNVFIVRKDNVKYFELEFNEEIEKFTIKKDNNETVKLNSDQLYNIFDKFFKENV